MRLEAIHLKAFGPYTNTRLVFPGRFTMVYGANEAGKSSVLRAVLALFFGVPERTGDNFLHDYAHLRVGASVSRTDGRCLDFVRRKGKTATLLDTDGKPLDERTLASFCGTLDEATFTHLFCLDHVRLRQGSSDLLAGNGEAGQSLFEAGTGLLGLKNALQQLEKEARDLFRPQGSQPILNRALARHTDARRKQKEHLLRGDDWKKQRQAVDDAQQARDACSADVRSTQRQVERLQRIARNFPLLARWQRACEEENALATAPDLPEGAAELRLKAQADVRLGEDQCRQLETQVADLAQRAASLSVDEALLAQGDGVEAAFAGLGGYRDAMTDWPQRVAKKQSLEAVIAGLCRSIPASCPEHDGAAAGLVRSLIKQHAPLATRAEETSRQRCELEQQLRADRQRLAQCGVVVDAAVLRTALETVRAHGNLETRLGELEAVLSGTERQVAAQLQALGWWAGPATAFERLAFPSRETLEKFDQQLTDIAAEERRLEREVRGLATERDRLLAERSRLEAAGEIASVTRVQAARSWREQGWALIRQTFVEGTLAEGEAATRYDGQPLVSGYEKAVGEADRLVDALHADTQRVTEYSVLSRRLESVQEAQSHLAAETRLLAARRTGLSAEWDDLWRALGVAGATPKECIGRLARREDVLRSMGLVRAQSAEVVVVRQQTVEAQRTLHSALQATGQDDLPPDASMGWLSGHATRCLERLEAQARQRDTLARQVFEREQAQAAMEPRWADASRKLAQWQESWHSAVLGLGLSADATPAEAEQVLDALDKLGQARQELSGIQGRLDGMAVRLRAFTATVERLTATVSGIDAALPPDATIELLYSRLGQARRAQQSRDTGTAQQHEKRAELAVWRSTVERALASLDASSRQAGCPVEELPDVERRSQRKRQVASDRRELEGHLTEQNGSAVEVVLAEALAEDRDALPGRLAAEQDRLIELERQRQLLTEKSVQAELALQAMDGSERAAEAAQEAQEALADIRDGAEAWLRLQTSAFILRHSIEAYRERNQGPLLKRASEIFAVLTLGSFLSVRTSFDDKDRLILVGVRPDGEEVAVDGMSEGTIDQLYLALRLSAIERHVAQGEPPPLLLDDILIHFDDERAQAAVQVLEQVSRHTQVLFFTHHQHLVRLAQQTLGSSLEVLQLGQTEVRWTPSVAVSA